MADVDVIVMATPLYFFAASAQLKLVFDRMFCLYKWDNEAGTMKTPLKGKTLVLMASAFEDVGLDALEKPFALTAAYTGMKFESLAGSQCGRIRRHKEKTRRPPKGDCVRQEGGGGKKPEGKCEINWLGLLRGYSYIQFYALNGGGVLI